ncbi:MAG: hypothetical protein KHX55_01475 [Proteobacteria bacterium]|nr:hypothetical protein [Pseudomonadota bacterium]
MMNLKAKIFTIFKMAIVVTCLETTLSYAQTVNYEQIQATPGSKFASDRKLNNWADVFKKQEGITEDGEKTEENVFQLKCGDVFCDTRSQECWMCRTANVGDIEDSRVGRNGGASAETSGKCYPKGTARKDIAGINCWKVEKDTDSSSLDKKGRTTINEPILKGSDGNLYKLAKTGDFYTIEYANNKTSMKGCEVLPVKLYNMRKCFFCPLFSVVFAASEKMPSITFNKLASAFATLIALGLAIWIAFQTLTHVSSLTKQDAPKFLAGLIKQSYKFLIAFLLLQYGNQIFQYVVNPVLEAGIDFGGQFLEYASASDKVKDDITKEIAKRAEDVPAYGYYISNDNKLQEDEKKALYKKLDYYVSSIQREIAFMQAVGSSLICTGNGKMFSKVSTTTFAQGFKMILQGLILAVFGFLLSIAFAFYMIDAVVQLGIVGALMPFLIASWPFKVTSQYAGTGFKMLLNSAFIFVFIGLTVEVNMQLVNAALTNNVSSGEIKIQSSTSDDVSFGGLQGIANAINTQNDTELVELTDISTMGFLILIFCCIFGFKFMGQVSSLAGQFSSGGIKPSAPSIATMGASAALSGAKKVTKPVREAVGRKAEDAEMAVVGAVAHPIRTAKSIGRSITSFANKFRGGKGGGDSDSESETTVENKEKSKSGTVENNGKPNGDKKKSPVVGQNNANKEKTTVTAANIKPGSNGSGENHNTAGDEKNVNNEGGSQGDNSVNEVNTNNETSADNNSALLNTGEPKEHKADSRKQRKYSGKKNRDRLQKNKQRRNYGRKHK